MGFDDIEDFPATQQWELTAEMLGEDAEPLQTKYVKFQKVTNLQFFFENDEVRFRFADLPICLVCFAVNLYVLRRAK